MKVLQFGDLHHDGATRKNTTKAMADVLELVERVRPDVVVNTGDLVMRRGQVSPELGRELREFHARLAEVAPVLVVAGNHDLPGLGGETGSVEGLLGCSRGDGRITLVERPAVVTVGGQQFACLPYPAKKVGEDSAEASAMLLRIVQGLVAVAPGAPLVFHGTVAGALPGTEAGMGFEAGLQLDEAQIPAEVPCVMAGHIHKPQAIGRAVYAGSTTALSFGEEQHSHGVVEWTCEGGRWTWVYHALEPAVRYLTVDLREKGEPGDALGAYLETSAAVKAGDLSRTIVRVLYRARRGVDAQAAGQRVRAMLRSLGAMECRLVPELVPDERAVQVHSFDDVAGTLAKWCKEQRLSDDATKLVLGLEARAAEELAGRVVESLGRGSYRLTSASWKDFRSLGTGAWDDEQLGRLVCIQGENASGKSNVAEVESFVLWGRSPRGRVSLADVPRRGTSGAWCSVTLEHGGNEWCVTRGVRLTPSGVGTATLTLQRREGGGWVAVEGQTAETQAKIESMVGSWEMYLATRFASQGDVDRLLSMRPAELKDVLQEAAALEQYADREEWGGAMEPGLKAALVACQARLDAARERVERARMELGMVEGELAAMADLERRAKERVARVDADLVTAQAKLESATEREAKAEAAARHAETLRAMREAAKKEVAEAQAEVERHSAALAEAADKAALLLATPVPAEPPLAAREAERERVYAELEGFHAKWNAKRAELAASWDERIGAVETRLAMAKQDAQEAERVLATETGRHEAAVGAFVRRREALTKLAGAANDVLFGDECKPCPLARSAMEAREALEVLEEPDAGPRERAMSAKKETAERVAAFHVELEGVRGQKVLALSQLEDEAKVGRDEMAQRVRLADELVKGAREEELLLRRHKERVAAAVAEGDRARELKAAAVARLERAMAVTAPWVEADEVVDVEGPRREVAEARAWLARLQDERKVAGADWRKVAESRSGLEARAKALAADSKPPVGEHEATLAAERALDSVQEYRRAMGRDGIPYLKVAESIGALQEWANEFLGAGDLRLSIEASRDTQKGEKKDEVVARYSNRFGGHELSAASGFERVALGYALRAAMARLHAENRGIRVGHWVADEGWGAFDEANLSLGQAMLERLGAAFERVFFISHVAAIREVADTVLTVEVDTENGSQVAVGA